MILALRSGIFRLNVRHDIVTLFGQLFTSLMDIDCSWWEDDHNFVSRDTCFDFCFEIPGVSHGRASTSTATPPNDPFSVFSIVLLGGKWPLRFICIVHWLMPSWWQANARTTIMGHLAAVSAPATCFAVTAKEDVVDNIYKLKPVPRFLGGIQHILHNLQMLTCSPILKCEWCNCEKWLDQKVIKKETNSLDVNDVRSWHQMKNKITHLPPVFPCY